jgi:hypothetical protein
MQECCAAPCLHMEYCLWRLLALRVRARPCGGRRWWERLGPMRLTGVGSSSLTEARGLRSGEFKLVTHRVHFNHTGAHQHNMHTACCTFERADRHNQLRSTLLLNAPKPWPGTHNALSGLAQHPEAHALKAGTARTLIGLTPARTSLLGTTLRPPLTD